VVAALGGPAAEVAAQREALRWMGVPVLPSPRALATAVTALVEDLRARTVPTAPVVSVDLSVRPGPFDEDQAKTVLGTLGVATPARRVCATREQAHAALAGLGGPVAVKLLDAAITHKSDVGGVRLAIADPIELVRAYEDFTERLGPDVVVAAMAPEGVEVALGIVRDPQFGPLVLVAAGGVLVELLKDRRLAFPQLDERLASGLVDRLRLRPLLEGDRGRPAADTASLARALVRLSVLAADLGEDLDGLDVNPMIVSPKGCVAVDALALPRAGVGTRRTGVT